MEVEKSIVDLRNEFVFNIENMDNYDNYTNVIWGLENKDFQAKIGLNDNELKSVLQIQHKILIVYLASVFESLLQDSMKIILKISFQRFENDSNRTMKYKDIFKSSSLNQLRKNIIEKELLVISYKSIKDQIELLKSEYSFEFLKEGNKSSDFKFLILLFQLRNILLHNKGIINQIFISNTDYPKHLKNSYFPFDVDFMTDAVYKVEVIGKHLLNELENKCLKSIS